jgi:hypothetical protein
MQQHRRQQDLANQMGIANLQQGLGGAAQDFSRAQISGLGTLGSAQQTQNQAILDAQRQAAQMAVQDPRDRLGMYGQGIAQITPGAGAVRLDPTAATAPSASPLCTSTRIWISRSRYLWKNIWRQRLVSRTLKRPMFRRGGTVNDGIMTGLTDRKQLANGYSGLDVDRARLESMAISNIMNELAPIPKTRLPIGQFGLDIATGTPIGEALKSGYGTFTKQDDARN